MTRRRVLILFAHPALHKSRVNRVLVERAREVEGVYLHDLYEEYPDFGIDVKREQALMEDADVVVLQHPFYWYSTPAMLKEWQDLVLQHGWAFGTGGTALAGKTLLSAMTAGGGEESYCGQGYNHYTVRELLTPIEQTARLCAMDYLPPFVIHGTHGLSGAEIDAHAGQYQELLRALVDDTLDRERARETHRLNADLATLIAG